MLNKRIKTGVIAILMIIVPILLVNSSQFIEPVTLGSVSLENLSVIRSGETIRCRWNSSIDVTNITVFWFKNGNSSPEFTNPVLVDYNDLAPEFTTEEDTWNCTVRISNGSDSINNSGTIYIEYDPLVFVEGILVNTTYTLNEDQNYTVVWNTTRAYNFYLVESLDGTDMCTETVDGTATCSPTNNELGNDKNTTGYEMVLFEYRYDTFSTQVNAINFTILAVNDPPEYTISNQTINQDERWDGPSATITISDEEGNYPFTYNISSPSFCTENTNPNSIVFNCTPNQLDIGNFTINVSVTDNAPNGIINKTTNKSFILEVTAVNQVPIISFASNYNSTQGEYYNITANATDYYDNTSLIFKITSSCSISNPWTNVNSTTTVINDNGNYTSYGTGIWNGTLTNNHIICRNITITVNDTIGDQNSTNYILNITNKNDAPLIYNYSSHPDDILNNHIINNLTAYGGAKFIYQINATDIDLFVSYNPLIDSFQETITYTSNSTWLNNYINNETGLINITGPNMNLTAGNHSFQIIVMDNGLTKLNDTKIMNIEVFNNQAPAFNQTLNFTCAEYDSSNYPQACFINISQYAYDPDNETGDNITNYQEDSNIFSMSSDGIIHFNATQENVSIHVFNVTITDSRGTSYSEEMYLQINNTNNDPQIINIEERVVPTGLYFNKSVNNLIPVTIIDNDLNLTGTNSSQPNYPYELLNITWTNNTADNLTGYISIVPNLTNDTSSINLIVNLTKLVNGSLLGIGNYSINLSVKDQYNKIDSYMYNFTVNAITGVPEINKIYPYGTPWSNITIFGWRNISSSDYITYINISENNTIEFSQNASDENPENLTYKWYYDGALLNDSDIINYNSSVEIINKSINFTFGFIESHLLGTKMHNLTVEVIDGYDETQMDKFTWMINVTDKNRPVEFRENGTISNITLSVSRNVENMDLWSALYTYGFYDPDFDYDGDGRIELKESNFSITYTVSDYLCDGYATINVTEPYSYITDSETNMTWISGHGMVANGEEIGVCIVNFTASDGEYNATSNNIQINVTSITSNEETTNVQDTVTSTRTVTETVEIPIPEEVENPIPIEIILPDMVTVYENNSIDIPLTITNTWDEPIRGVRLEYELSNTSKNYSVEFQRSSFYEIRPGDILKTKLTVSNYRVGEIYEILVKANVTDPPYLDSAKVYLNSIEQSSTGAQVKTLIRFAQDLLESNKECQELGEILKQAQELREKGQFDETLEILNSVINGCKYLISKEQMIQEQPRRLREIHIPLKAEYLKYLIALIVTIGIIGGIVLLSKRIKKGNKESKTEQ